MRSRTSFPYNFRALNNNNGHVLSDYIAKLCLWRGCRLETLLHTRLGKTIKISVIISLCATRAGVKTNIVLSWLFTSLANFHFIIIAFLCQHNSPLPPIVWKWCSISPSLCAAGLLYYVRDLYDLHPLEVGRAQALCKQDISSTLWTCCLLCPFLSKYGVNISTVFIKHYSTQPCFIKIIAK